MNHVKSAKREREKLLRNFIKKVRNHSTCANEGVDTMGTIRQLWTASGENGGVI